MKKFWQLNTRRLAIWFAGWLVATNLLVGFAHITGLWPFKVALFLCLVFLPGVVILRIMRISLRTFSASALYSFGLSILVLMLSGLATNQILYMFGIGRPLQLAGILGVWDVVVAALIIISIFRNPKPLRLPALRAKTISGHAWILGGLSLLLPCFAVAGAFRLNNGGDALFAQITLCFAAALIAYAFIFRRRLPSELLAWFIFIIGLTLLLMTSLRGWDIVGHDIEREFRVYTLTSMHGHWDISLDRDPYNACLSITILPQVFAQLLHVSGLIVFKVILQIIFAACPVVLFVLLRQYVSKLGALLGSMLFVCYPTFINDSAMLTRQGVAYLFFALALLVISNQAQKERYKVLFLLCSLGAVLSHYSTAYMYVALFVAAAAIKLISAGWQHYKRRTFRPKRHAIRTILSPLFALLIFAFTFIWYTQITATSNGLVTTLNKSFSNLPKLFTEDNKSSDTSTVLLFAGGKTQVDLYQAYMENTPQRFGGDTTSALQYAPMLASDELPYTPLGKQAHTIGIDSALINMLRQNFAKVLQLLALVGVLYATYRLLRKKPDALNPDFVCLSLAGIVLLACMVILPVLSINYGILRAFQQGLIFLLLPITLLLVKLGQRLWGWLSTTIVTIGIVVLFLTFSGLFGQILGGGSPALSMNNQGLYYGLYYSPQADARAFTWLKQNVQKGNDVRAANFNRAIMHDPEYPFKQTGILPAQITDHSYVYLDQAQTLTQKMFTYYESSSLITTFPIDYYQTKKNQVYSTTTTGIYR